jgi:hypothetical protein
MINPMIHRVRLALAAVLLGGGLAFSCTVSNASGRDVCGGLGQPCCTESCCTSEQPCRPKLYCNGPLICQALSPDFRNICYNSSAAPRD